MTAQPINMDQSQVYKLLCTGSGDAALLYLYIHSGNAPANAMEELKLTKTRFDCAAATLRQLGLWPEEKKTVILSGERPHYSETDVIRAMDTDRDFKALYGEVQLLLGKSLNNEELKILLGFTRYLGLSPEVISVLITYCKERARQKGSIRTPSLRTIEKEAYAWAEQSIDTMEEAAAYIQNQNQRNSRIHQIMGLLQIRGRNLTPGEEKYAKQWLVWGFDDQVISMAYERTCLNTGGLSWAYMNKILTRWNEAGLHTAEQVQKGDQKKSVPMGATGQLGKEELAAIQRTLQEV